jgi:hypothetical protein
MSRVGVGDNVTLATIGPVGGGGVTVVPEPDSQQRTKIAPIAQSETSRKIMVEGIGDMGFS